MKIEVIMPQMGESVAEGTIIKWWKKPGDKVEKDETLFEISTDKVDTEIPSPDSGILVEILFGEGETIAINTVIAYIETEAEKADVKTAPAKPAAEAAAPIEVEKEKTPPAKAPPAPPLASPAREPELPAAPAAAAPVPPAAITEDGGKRSFLSPVVLRIASEEGISLDALNTIKGSGIGGRITKKDVLANLERLKAAPAAPPVPPPAVPAPAPAAPSVSYDEDGVRVVPMSNMRQKIAEHMVRSVQTSPHVTTAAEVDMTGIVKYRAKENKAFEEREGIKLTYTAFIVRAIVKAIEEFPEFNASIDDINVIYKKHINMGVAVALEKGLIVPVIKHAEEMNIVGLARTLSDLGTRARNKKLMPEDVQGATISLTNPGIYGTLFGTPIINQPNVAIIGVGAIKKRPVIVNDMIAVRDMMFITATYDHRLIDGAVAAQFMQRITHYLEDVETLI